MTGRVRMTHPNLPGREIVAHPSPVRLAAGWRPVDELEHATAAPPEHSAVSPDTAPRRQRRNSNTQEGTEG